MRTIFLEIVENWFKSREIRKVYSKVVSAIEKGHFDLWPYSIQTTTNAGTVIENTEDVTRKELALLKIMAKNKEWAKIKLVLAFIIGIMLGFAIGYIQGVNDTIHWIAKVAEPYVSIDIEALERLIFEYKK